MESSVNFAAGRIVRLPLGVAGFGPFAVAGMVGVAACQSAESGPAKPPACTRRLHPAAVSNIPIAVAATVYNCGTFMDDAQQPATWKTSEMIPTRIHLKNFLSYRGNVSIDFTGLGLACLSGENGAGKSALFDAMTWAIWGKSRAQRDVDLISLGESEAEVTLEFRMGRREYRIMRRRTRSRATLEFDARTPGAENWLPIGGDSIRDTQARIVTELNLDYDTFANSAFLRQGEADLFTQNKPNERKRILSDILDLSEYDRLVEEARSELRNRRARLDAIQSRLGQIDVQLASRHQVEVEQAELEEAIESAEQRRAALQATLDALRDRIAAAETSEEHLKRTRLRIARLQEQAAQSQSDRTRITGELAELEEIASREDVVTRELEDLRDWRARADQLGAALSARQPILARVQQLEREIASARSEIEQRRALAVQSARSTRERLEQIEQFATESKRLQATLGQHQRELAALPAQEARLKELQERVSQLKGENVSLRSRMDEIMQRIESLNDGDATCPICRRPLAEGEHDRIRDEWTVEGRALGDKFRANKSRFEEMEREIALTQADIRRLQTLSRESAATEARLNQLRQETAAQPQLAATLAETEREAAELAATLAAETFCPEQRSELLSLAQKLEATPYDEQAHNEARARSKELDRAERDYRRLEQAKADIASRRTQLESIDARIKEIAGDLEEAMQDAADLEKTLAGIDETRREHQARAGEVETLSASIASMEQRRGSLRRRLEELDELSAEHRSLTEESRTLSAETDAYNELATAFGRNGIQAMVIENVLPELQDEANRILSRMATNQLAVEFHTTRAAVSTDSTIETLDIVIRDESGRRDYQLFSGGEAFRIDFAIRVALSKLLARRAGASVDTLIIDEGFGSQDEHGRDGLIEALQSVTRDFDLILVITHVDELRYQFPNRIEIVKTHEGSRATLV